MQPRKILGMVSIIAAVTGSIFSVYAIVQVWRVQPTVTQSLTENLELLDQTLATTQDGLAIVDDVVQTSIEDIALFHGAIDALALAIQDTTSILDSLSSLTGTDLPATITATQTSLASAQGSALLIDNMMTAITSIPFLGMTAYQPEVPLNVALVGISESLDPLTPSLVGISTDLSGATTNLGTLETELQTIADTTQDISDSLTDTQSTIAQYQTILTDVKGRVNATQLVIPANVRTFGWILTLTLGAIFFAMIGLGMYSVDLLQQYANPPDPETKPAGDALADYRFERLRFFQGQLLTVDDFKTDQNYFMEKQRLHNRFLHGWGIVSGLEITPGKDSVTVSPGLAIDCAGNEILLGNEVKVSISDGVECCHILIEYTETDDRPTLIPGGTQEDGETLFAFTRIRAACRVFSSENNPLADHAGIGPGSPGCGLKHPLVIATLKLEPDGWRLA